MTFSAIVKVWKSPTQMLTQETIILADTIENAMIDAMVQARLTEGTPISIHVFTSEIPKVNNDK